MNHSCDPNVQVRTLPRSFTPPTSLPAELPGRGDPSDPPSHKITVIAREPITPGTELTITYVDPSLPRNVRRQALRDGYGFWCECARCEREKRAEEEERAAREAENARIEKAAQEAFEKAKAAAEGAGSKAGVDEVAAKIAEL
jgi:flagellar biosynthesis/type III secretory pathway protein FliH